MPFQISPGVNVSEVDLSTVIPGVSTSTGAFVGRFQWGPVGERTLIGSENQLADTFFKPDANNAVDFLTAASFLSYTNALQTVRVVDETVGTGARNAQSGGSPSGVADPGKLIKNDIHFDSFHGEGAAFANTFYARFPGELGNDLVVELCDHAGDAVNNIGFANWASNVYFDAAPGNSAGVSAAGGSFDEVHIAVIDNKGYISGTVNTYLEVFPALSKAKDATNDQGNNIYFKDVINRQSQWIRVGSPTGETAATYGNDGSGQVFANTAKGKASLALSGGSSGAAPSQGNYVSGYDLFTDKDSVDVGLVIAGSGGVRDGSLGTGATTIAKAVNVSRTSRKDSVTFFSPEFSSVNAAASSTNLTNVLADRTESYGNFNTSYAVMDSGWKLMYDKYNDTSRYVPLNGDTAGLCARTDQLRDSWFSPAGYDRGQINNVIRLAWNPSKAERDDLYRKQINPVVSFPGQGTILFGDKTLQTKPSAFDRINVRRLFIVLEKAISTAAKFSLFEFNDEFTRAQFRNMVEPFLRDVKGRRGLTDFKVVCDESNNPGSVIDRNEFVGDIYLKPTRSINFIQLNFVAVSTGVDFTEIAGKF